MENDLKRTSPGEFELYHFWLSFQIRLVNLWVGVELWEIKDEPFEIAACMALTTTSHQLNDIKDGPALALAIEADLRENIIESHGD